MPFVLARIEPMEWTFLTNYAHVLVCLIQDPSMRLRDVANRVGITERAVQRIVHDLQDGNYIEVIKEGRRNHYRVNTTKKLRHPIEKAATISDLAKLVS
jgi:predicted transcriptional regulator